jgi:hypothetical protein
MSNVSVICQYVKRTFSDILWIWFWHTIFQNDDIGFRDFIIIIYFYSVILPAANLGPVV